VDSLIFLAHRLPFPPNKGDKVRSYHWLRHLAERYRVFLGAFIDDPSDWQHIEGVRALCADLHVEPLVPWSKRIASAAALMTGEAMTLPYFRSRALNLWVKAVAAREDVRRVFAYSSPMAQYALDIPNARCVVDFVDMDSAKWAEYAQRRSWPLSTIYEREAERLLAFERSVAQRADATLFVTAEEAKLFCDRAPECAGRVVPIRNGVDGEYFSPACEHRSPFRRGEHPIVFTGAMDYWPNIDAVLWFAREVLPEILKQDSSARFYVVGMNPDAVVRALTRSAATIVTGRVPDVRPYLQHARVVVAPLRVARGIQNKVLEAMAMARPVVASTACAGPIGAAEGRELLTASNAAGFADQIGALLAGPRRAFDMGRAARERVVHHFGWAAQLAAIDRHLAPETPKVAA
jgi:sugar transferase (PEP-CTERM/EpsH1 system associated)